MMLRRLRRRGGGRDADPHGDGHGGDGPDSQARASAGPLSAPFDEEAGHEQLQFQHVLMKSDGRRQRHGGGVGGHKSVNAATPRQQQPRSNVGAGEEARAKSPLLNSVQVRVVSPPPASKSPPSSPSSARRQGRARQKLDRTSPRGHQRHQLEYQQMIGDMHNDKGLHASSALTVGTANTLTGGSSTTADTSDTPYHHRKPPGQQRSDTNRTIVPPSSLTQHLAAACDAVNGMNDGVCNADDLKGMAGNPSFDSSYDSKDDFHNVRRQQQKVNRGSLDNRYTGIHPEYDDGGQNGGAGQGAAPRPRNVRQHDHDYRPAPPQRRSKQSHLAGQARERRRIDRQLQSQRQRRLREQREQLERQKRRQRKEASHPRLQVEVVNSDKGSEDNVVVTPREVDSPQRTVGSNTARSRSENVEVASSMVHPAGSDRSKSVPKERIRATADPMAVTPSPPSEKSRDQAVQQVKDGHPQQRREQGQPQQRTETALPTRQQPVQEQKQRTERLRPKSAPPSRPSSEVDVRGSTSPSAAPTAKMANSSSKLINRLLRRHGGRKAKAAMEPEEEGPAEGTRRTKQQQQQKAKVSCNGEGTRGSDRQAEKQPAEVSSPADTGASAPSRPPPPSTEPPSTGAKGEEPPEEALDTRRPHRPDPPAEYRHMASYVDPKAVRGKNPPAAYRHMQSTVDPNTLSSRPEPQSTIQNRQTPQPPSQLESQRLTRREHSNPVAGEWSTPIPFKKVNSTPSNFSSFFTTQTTNTATTLGSKFWEEVEEFSDPHYPKKRLFHGRKRGEHEREYEEYFEAHLVDVKRERLEDYDTADDGEQRQSPAEQQPQHPKRTRKGLSKGKPKGSKAPSRRQPSPLESVGEDEVSNAFSLKLPMRRHGGFDDSDISALQMNDSATVFFQQQQSANDADAVNDYWKRKYDLLKEETERARGVTKKDEKHHHEQRRGDSGEVLSGTEEDTDVESKQVELQEMMDHHSSDPQRGSAEARQSPATHGSVTETYDDTLETEGDNTLRTEWTDSYVDDRRLRCTSPLDAINDLLDGVIDMDNCELDRGTIRNSLKGDYRGGKKGRDRNLRAKCSPGGAGLTQEELEWIAIRAQKAKEASVDTMRKTAEEMVNFVSKLERDSQQRDGPSRRGSRDVLHCKSPCSVKNLAGDTMVSPADVTADTTGSTHEKSYETDGFDLKPLCYVPPKDTPTCIPTTPKEDLETQPKSLRYVMGDEDESNDMELLQQFRKNRQSPKSLADDLTAGASRLSRHTRASAIDDGDESELSENAKMIFEAALKYDVRALRGQRGQSAVRSPPPRSTASVSSAAGSSNFGSNIPADFARWFELPSPGSVCMPLLPLLDVQFSNSIAVRDAEDVPAGYRANDSVNLAFSDFVRAAIRTPSSESNRDYENSMGPIVADGDNGSVRFANASIHLRGISDAAIYAISQRQFQDAMEIYNTLLRSCQTSSGSKLGVVGQLIASTLHNLSVLHLWNREYDQALPYCRESLRIKTELVGDDAGSVNSWANLGLINYAKGSFPSALAAYRKAVQVSEHYGLTGRLMNNMALINFEIGKLPLVQSQFRQSLQMQKGTSASFDDDADASTGEDLFSISVTIFNVGVVCARQNQIASAASHVKACLAIQQALLDKDDGVVLSTAHYLGTLKKPTVSSSTPPKANTRNANQSAQPNAESSKTQAIEPDPALEPASHRIETPEPPRPNTEPTHQQQAVCSAPENPAMSGTCNSRENNAPFSAQKRGQLSHSRMAQNSRAAQKQHQQLPNSLNRGQNSQAGSGQISHPMLCLGSLRAEATATQRVQQSLENCADSLALRGIATSHNMNQLLCKRPTQTSSRKTMSQNIINFGIQAMKKREALSDLQRNLQRYGPRHPLVGEAHRNLGLFHLYTENYKDAVTHLTDASRIYSNALGAKHPDVASTVMFKGLAQLAFERLDDSMATLCQLRRIRGDVLGLNHPEIGQILNNMACVHYELGDYKGAESMFQEALDLQREVFMTEPAFLRGVSVVLSNIAFLHAKSGSFSKALIELEGALQIRQDILLEDNSMSEIRENMAHILAIHQLQHGAVNLDEVTEEYITMLKTSESRR